MCVQVGEWLGRGEVYGSVVLVLIRVQIEVTRELTAIFAEKLCVFLRAYNRVCA
jgi:hypothetical protein